MISTTVDRERLSLDALPEVVGVGELAMAGAPTGSADGAVSFDSADLDNNKRIPRGCGAVNVKAAATILRACCAAAAMAFLLKLFPSRSADGAASLDSADLDKRIQRGSGAVNMRAAATILLACCCVAAAMAYFLKLFSSDGHPCPATFSPLSRYDDVCPLTPLTLSRLIWC